MNRWIRFEGLWQATGWVSPAYVKTDAKGIILKVQTTLPNGEAVEEINGLALPGFQNAHSHAFQFAMAGTAERHAWGTQDDFWSWRENMYGLALRISPDEMEEIAYSLYRAMLRHGFTQVAEFHYLHHDTDGKPYGHLAEMGERLVRAAQRAGIGITLVPMYYQKGGFNAAPSPRQRRFISPSTDAYLQLLEASKQVVAKYPHARLGCGIHSLRAIAPKEMAEVVRQLPTDLPFHIHIAEQQQEVAQCEAFLGKRPVRWLLDNVEVTARFHLVHATHLTLDEITGIAQSGAHVVLCPTTEGNLGDGIFPLMAFQQAGGAWSIGTDSHVGLNPMEELRLLDYGQRLIHHRRNIFGDPKEGDSGTYALRMAQIAGRKAMGNESANWLEPGEPLEAVVYHAQHFQLRDAEPAQWLSILVYAEAGNNPMGTLVNGKWVWKQGESL
jgi:formiminoglutamate deiminase